MIATTIPKAHAQRITKKELREQIAAAARCLKYARAGVDSGDFKSAAMWSRFAEKDLHEVETLLRGA